jgi:uncharacterized protein YutE (UPF0331/DUF86 family)
VITLRNKCSNAARYYSSEMGLIVAWHLSTTHQQLFCLQVRLEEFHLWRAAVLRDSYADATPRELAARNATLDAGERHGTAVLAEMIYCRTVDGFERYLKDILVTIYRASPDALKSQQQVSVEEVLGYHSLADFINAYAAERADRISRGGLREYTKAFASLGLPDLFTEEEFDVLKKSFDLRNDMVHRNVLADCFDAATFFRRHEKRMLALHGKLTDVLSWFMALTEAVDARITSKFQIAFTGDEWFEEHAPKGDAT